MDKTKAVCVSIRTETNERNIRTSTSDVRYRWTHHSSGNSANHEPKDIDKEQNEKD